MTPIDIVLALLALVAKLAPGLLAAITSTATDEEAIAAARAALPAHLDADDPDPERDRARRERIADASERAGTGHLPVDSDAVGSMAHALGVLRRRASLGADIRRRDVRALLAASSPAVRAILVDELRAAPSTPPIRVPDDPYGEE